MALRAQKVPGALEKRAPAPAVTSFPVDVWIIENDENEKGTSVVKDAHRGLANQRAAFCDVTTLNEVGIRGFVWNKLCKFMRFAIQDGGP